MTITTERFTKDGIATFLTWNTWAGRYWVALDDVVLAEGHSSRGVWVAGQDARKALTETGWTA